MKWAPSMPHPYALSPRSPPPYLPHATRPVRRFRRPRICVLRAQWRRWSSLWQRKQVTAALGCPRFRLFRDRLAPTLQETEQGTAARPNHLLGGMAGTGAGLRVGEAVWRGRAAVPDGLRVPQRPDGGVGAPPASAFISARAACLRLPGFDSRDGASVVPRRNRTNRLGDPGVPR